MTLTQTQIDELLETLKSLLDQIAQLRQKAAELEKGLTQAEGDYNEKLSSLNAEADRLEALKASLKFRLAQKTQEIPEQSATIIDTLPVDVELPPEIIEPKLGELPPPPKEDPRYTRKQMLADHIEYFVVDSDREPIMQEINAVLADERQDLGDMLERLNWGEIWKARADWETLEDQYARLESWKSALEERLTYWQQQLCRVEQDPRYSLWQEMTTYSHQEWLAFLDNLARQQEEENASLAHEVSVLEQQWQTKQAESEVKNV